MGYRWWKQACRPDLHKLPHPHPGFNSRPVVVPQWFKTVRNSQHVKGGPPPPDTSGQPCGMPTASTAKDPRFAHLTQPVPFKPTTKGDAKEQKKTKKKKTEKKKTEKTPAATVKDGDEDEGEDEDDKPLTATNTRKNPKVDDKGKSQANVKEPSKSKADAKAKTETKAKTTPKTKSDAKAKVEAKKTKTKAQPEVLVLSSTEADEEGTSTRRSARKQAKVSSKDTEIKPAAEPVAKSSGTRKSSRPPTRTAKAHDGDQQSDVEVQEAPSAAAGKSKKTPKPKPKVKKEERYDQPDVETNDPPAPQVTTAKAAKKGGSGHGTQPPTASSSTAGGKVREQRVFVVIPAKTTRAVFTQRVATPGPSTKSPPVVDVPSVAPSAPPLNKVGPPVGASRKRARPNQRREPYELQGFHPDRAADDVEDADVHPSKRRKNRAKQREEDIVGQGQDAEQSKGNTEEEQHQDLMDAQQLFTPGPDPHGMHTPSVPQSSVTISPWQSPGRVEQLTYVESHIDFSAFQPQLPDETETLPVMSSRTPSLLEPAPVITRSNAQRSVRATPTTPTPRSTLVPAQGVSKASKKGNSVLRLTPVAGEHLSTTPMIYSPLTWCSVDIDQLKTHSPATFATEDEHLSQMADIQMTLTGEYVVKTPDPDPQPSDDASPASVAVHDAATTTSMSAEEQLASALKIADTVRETLLGSYRILVTHYQQGDATFPETQDPMSTIEMISDRLRNLTVDLLLFGTLFHSVSTCFETLAEALRHVQSDKLELEGLADSTRMLLELYTASGQEWGRLRDMLAPVVSGGLRPGLDVRLAEIADRMKRDMNSMGPAVQPLPEKLLEALADPTADLPRILVSAGKVLAAGADVVRSEREAMNGVMVYLPPPPAPIPTPLPHSDSEPRVFGPAFPTTEEVMDTLAGVSRKLVTLESDVERLKKGEFVEDYLKSLGVTPTALKACGRFAKTMSTST